MTLMQTSEVRAWVRLHDRTGHVLPDPVTDALVESRAVEKEIQELGEAPRILATHELAAEGVPVREIPAEQRRRDALAADHALKVSDLRYALEVFEGSLTAAVVAHRDTLILGLRPAVATLIAKARPIVAKGWDDRDVVLGQSDGKANRALQEITRMESDFGLMMAAWRESFTTARLESDFDIRRLSESFQYFVHPDLVRDDGMAGRGFTSRGQIRRVEVTLAGIAREDEDAGFRLATLQELRDIVPGLERLNRETGGRTRPELVGIGLPAGAR